MKEILSNFSSSHGHTVTNETPSNFYLFENKINWATNINIHKVHFNFILKQLSTFGHRVRETPTHLYVNNNNNNNNNILKQTNEQYQQAVLTNHRKVNSRMLKGKVGGE